MTAEVSKLTPDVASLTRIHEDARIRRQERVEKILRPGLGGSKRKAPCTLELTDALKNALNTIEHNLQDLPKDQHQTRPPRRERLVLREGLNRVIPQCKVAGLDFAKDRIASVSPIADGESVPDLLDARLTNFTAIEGVPERWMEVIQHNSDAEFRFTPIEGVLERLIVGASSVGARTPSKKLSIFSDIEGVPERQWTLPSIKGQGVKPLKNRTLGFDEEKVGSNGHTGERVAVSDGHDGHTGESCYVVGPQEQVPDAEVQDRSQNSVEGPESVMKTYSQELFVPELEILDTPGPRLPINDPYFSSGLFRPSLRTAKKKQI